MKNNSALSKKILTYTALICVLCLVCVYFLVYKKYMESGTKLSKENATLNQHIEELEQYHNNRSTYETEMAEIRKELRGILAEFPADVREEDSIYLVLQAMSKANLSISNINIGERAELITIPAAEVGYSGLEELTEDLTFVSRKTAYVNKTDYQNLKQLVASVNTYDYRSNISNLSYSRNEAENCLEGTIEVTFYSLPGTGREYEERNFAEYESGLADLFRLSSFEGLTGE